MTSHAWPIGSPSLIANWPTPHGQTWCTAGSLPLCLASWRRPRMGCCAPAMRYGVSRVVRRRSAGTSWPKGWVGYWAARYQGLPGRPAGQDAGWSPREALACVHRLHGPGFQVSGSISGAIKGLDAEPSFPPTIDLVNTRGDLAGFLSELTELCAGVYLAQTDGLIAFVHAVTAPSALRPLLPYLAEADARLAARYAWQACAALYAWYATTSGPSSTTLAPITESHDTLIDRAIAAEGAHTIKFTEACLREYAINPKPVYLVAARDVAERVGAR